MYEVKKMKQTFVITIINQRQGSNLLDWNTFGEELATEEGRDVWLIEITGGSGTGQQDCPTCVNYNFTNMTQFYVPALLSGVEQYSQQHTMQYVGFSNGCRATLSSLDMYDSLGKTNAGYYFDQNDGLYKSMNMSANLVRDFIGVGCPGNFTGSSPVSSVLVDVGANSIKDLKKDGLTHVSETDAGKAVCSFSNLLSPISTTYGCGALGLFLFFGGSDKISVELFNDYYQFMASTSDRQPGENVSVNKLTIIYGVAVGSSDGAVTDADAQGIFNSITSTDKQRCADLSTHIGLPDSDDVQDIVKRRLNGASLPNYYACANS